LEYFDLLRLNERLLLLNHYINHCQTTIMHVQTERESLVHELADQPTPTFLENVVRVMKDACFFQVLLTMGPTV